MGGISNCHQSCWRGSEKQKKLLWKRLKSNLRFHVGVPLRATMCREARERRGHCLQNPWPSNTQISKFWLHRFWNTWDGVKQWWHYKQTTQQAELRANVEKSNFDLICQSTSEITFDWWWYSPPRVQGQVISGAATFRRRKLSLLRNALGKLWVWRYLM